MFREKRQLEGVAVFIGSSLDLLTICVSWEGEHNLLTVLIRLLRCQLDRRIATSYAVQTRQNRRRDKYYFFLVRFCGSC